MATLFLKLNPSTEKKLRTFLQTINSLVYAAALGLIFMTFDLYRNNNAEISKRDYIYLNDVVKKSNNPDLKIMVKKAMSDNKITNQELYNLTH